MPSGAIRVATDREVRPRLVVRIIQAMQNGGVEPDIWKIEGPDTAEACSEVVAKARQGGRGGVCCVVLGRGAEERQVVECCISPPRYQASTGSPLAGPSGRDRYET
jgi:hypothetical protein